MTVERAGERNTGFEDGTGDVDRDGNEDEEEGRCLFYAATMAEPDSRADTAKRCALQKFIKSHLAAGGEQSSVVQSLVLEWNSRQDLVTAKTGTEDGD